MEQITKNDLLLVSNLSKREYSGNKLLSNANEDEKEQLKNIKQKLKEIADYFSKKYGNPYGPFQTDIVTGNDIAMGGKKLKGMWSALYKGAEDKQYAAQIMFGIDPNLVCFDVGFWFGSAASRKIERTKRINLEKQLKTLGLSLANSLKFHEEYKQKFFNLFDFGFSAYSKGEVVTVNNWIELTMSDPKSSGILAKIYPNDFGIEYSKIDFYVSQVIFLMGGISNSKTSIAPIKSPTPEQRAKQAERLAEIGTKGEEFIMKTEREKLERLNFDYKNYLKHVAMESDSYGYDIISLDEKGNEIYIEVKTTTRKKEDVNSKIFFISSNEYSVYEKNKSKYKLYRVYDIENSPSFEEIDLEIVDKKADGYICKY